MAFPRRSHGDIGVFTELHGDHTAFQLAIACALVAFPLRATSCHGARTACALRVHGAHIALTAFFRIQRQLK